MILFKLTMPNIGSWNDKWSGSNRNYSRVMHDKDVPKELWDKDFYYGWDDGWTACVSVSHMNYKDAQKENKRSDGFSGYDWMIRSIIKYGEILDNRKAKEKYGT